MGRIALLLLGLLVASDHCAARVPSPCRGVWVASVGSGSLGTPEGVREVVANAKRSGINTLFVVTWNRGVTLYPSPLMEREFGVLIDPRLAGRDPLKELIDEAHAHGLAVVAWFEFGFSSSYQTPDGGPLLRKRPGWAALGPDGKLVSKNGFQWMNAFDPEVQDFLLAMIKEVVENYDVDGVQGDDRLPAVPSTAGYSPQTVALYKSEHNGEAPPLDPRQREWIVWRADRLSQFVERAYRELKAIDPELCVSWSPSVYPWSVQNYLQDWPRWCREGWGDLFCPQVYREDVDRYRHELRQIVETQVPPERLASVAPGVLVSLADGFRAPDERVRQMVAANREFGFQGEVFFYHSTLEKHAEVFKTLYTDEATR
ncbi:MAG: glycoside hydrolase family 10 protein [Lacipirellulaceae bacterium]